MTTSPTQQMFVDLDAFLKNALGMDRNVACFYYF